MLQKQRILLLYGALFASWVLVIHRFAHARVTTAGGPDWAAEITEDLAMIAGGIALIAMASRRGRSHARELGAAESLSEFSLRAKAAQQAAVAALGQRALEGATSQDLAREAVETVRRTLGVDACSVVEHVPGDGGFRMRATAGFEETTVGSIVALDGARSMSGYTVQTGRPLALTDWRTETRFSPSAYLLERGIVSVATTPIRGAERPYGVMSVCSKTRRGFTEDDASFLTSVANVLAATLERERIADEASRFFDMSSDLMAITDLSGVIRRVNPALARTLGDGTSQIGRSYLDFVHPEDRALARADRLVAMHPGDSSVESRCIAPDGTYRRLEWTFQTDMERQLVYSVARDVTTRRRMEADHALLARTIAQVAETVVITGPDAVIQYVNPAFERVTGYTREEAVGRMPSMLKSGQHTEAFYAALWRTLLAGDVWTGRLVNRRKDGTAYQAEGTITPVRDAAGTPVNYVAVMRDVTREALLEAQFHQSQRLEVVGRLAGGVAHDFNNLLCVIDGYGDLLAEELPATGDSRSHLAQIRAASERAARLTRQLLAFSRKQDMRPRVLRLNTAVLDSSKLWVRLLGEDVRFVPAFAEDAGRVRADPGQLDQVLMNLAVNARDAMPAGGTLTVETKNVELDAAFVAAHPGALPGRYVRLSVVDTGVGMDAATMARIFEPFFTTKAPGKGSGLGLATVYGIVKQSDGYVEAESEPGRGTAFRVYLPRVDEDVSSQEIAMAANAPHGVETILVAEDAEQVRELMCTVLRRAGYTVLECASGGEAAAAAKSARPGSIALLVSDVVMPDMDGPETARHVCAAQPAIRVLLVSGHTFEVMGERGVVAEDVDLLLKPFTPDALLTRVRAALDAPLRARAAVAHG